MKILVHQSYISDILKMVKPQQHVQVIRVVEYYNQPIHPEAFLITVIDHRIVENMDVPYVDFTPNPKNKKYNDRLREKIEDQKKRG